MNESDFIRKPDNNSWSVSEVAEHIYRTEVIATRILSSKSRSSDHDSAAKVEEIQDKFIDRSRKLTAFGPIVPIGSVESISDIIQKLKSNRVDHIDILKQLDLDELCLMFEHPLFGHMTRREWIIFNSTHADRHKAQIEEIREILSI